MNVKFLFDKSVGLAFLLMFSVVLLISCAAKENSGSNVSLKNTYWQLSWIGGKQIEFNNTNRRAYILLDDEKRVSGSDGCNRLMGSYETNAGQLRFGQLASTRMACLDGADVSVEFNKALTTTESYLINGTQLQLLDGNNKLLAKFSQQAGDFLKADKK